jgi:CubicO group peptidase (beta-lactamase class C family)
VEKNFKSRVFGRMATTHMLDTMAKSTSSERLKSYLGRAIRRHDIPGVSVAVLESSGATQCGYAGIANAESGLRMNSDTLFQIGSVTKPMTAMLILQLVDEKLVDLDDKVSRFLPGWNRSTHVTIRHLLSHTSGVEGDFSVDAGRGDGAVRRYVDKATMLPSYFQPGEMMSYCNLGYSVLARLVEVVRCRPFQDCLRDNLFKPLGMRHSFARPENAIRFNCAVGHVGQKGDRQILEPNLSFGEAGAGSLTYMTAADLVRFAQCHLDGGTATDGTRVLSKSSVRAMQRSVVPLCPHSRFGIHGWGLGWSLMKWSGQRVYGHTGASPGVFSFLCIIPDENIVVALLANGGGFRAVSLFESFCKATLESKFGVTPPPLPEVRFRPKDLAAYAGCYENTWARIELTQRQDLLWMQTFDRSTGQTLNEPMPLGFIDRRTARVDSGDIDSDREIVAFSAMKSGASEFLQIDLRQLRRVPEVFDRKVDGV